MTKSVKVAGWIIGAILLVMLVQYPIQKSTSTWNTWSLPLAGKTIVLDPGHGGVDGGAVGADETLEKDIALDVSKYLRNYLQQAGALVYMTRETDRDLAAEDTDGYSRRKAEDLRNRVDLIKEKEADFVVSVHLNALPSDKWSGAQTFFYPSLEKSEQLAELIQAEIKRNLDNTNRDARAVNMYLLKHAQTPGALVEIGFLSNVQEREQLKTEDYQRKMAASIYEGILRYVTEGSEEKEE
ncbi:N-acetylmuramoyl-L-alanine amidase CwlD [Aquibacillus sediminis]|uniref:N-acetylmuramoyl-L-alanine amidase CwlD n=1 Tax=Aquibacillus sediminis TaxID=2574734 RepID=UPI001109A63E|nr:N-acetylmuramoyl-L-alanine amidase CwlD [Aquibacillus sediminis]